MAQFIVSGVTLEKERSKRVSRIINVTLVFVAVIAWLGQRHPGYGLVFLAVAALASLAGIAAVFGIGHGKVEEASTESTMTIKDGAAERYERDRAQLESLALVASRMSRGRAQSEQVERRLAQIRAQVLNSYGEVSQVRYLEEMIRIGQLAKRSRGTVIYNLEPVQLNYTLKLGIVTIEVRGDEAAVKLADASRVVIESIAKPTSVDPTNEAVSADSNSNEFGTVGVRVLH